MDWSTGVAMFKASTLREGSISSDDFFIFFDRFLLEWLSFTHRYVPAGIIEHSRQPQTIFQKPPCYVSLYRSTSSLIVSVEREM